VIHKPNILIIGASGGVAGAFLKRIVRDRVHLGKLLLVDRFDRLLHDPFFPHRELSYEFLKADIDVRGARSAYLEIIEERGIHVVIDLSVNETRPMLQATDAMGISYINTGIANRKGKSFADVVLDVIKRKDGPWHAPHILCAGMNPGIVNMWVRKGIERFGRPASILHFEYDTGQPVQGWLPLITWSRETFLDEIVNDPAGYMEGRDKLRFLYPNPLKNRVDMREVLGEVMDLEEYPRGYLLLHEENISIAQHYDIPSRFIFAILPRTMTYLESLYNAKGAIPVDALTLGDNQKVILQGSATVGVLLDYGGRKVYFFNTTEHGRIQGSSGSCWQVAAGLHAALFTLLEDRLSDRIYFVEDLMGTSCERLVKENLPMKELLIKRRSHGV